MAGSYTGWSRRDTVVPAPVVMRTIVQPGEEEKIMNMRMTRTKMKGRRRRRKRKKEKEHEKDKKVLQHHERRSVVTAESA